MENSRGTQIRKATKEDLDAIVSIENQCFPGQTAYSRNHLSYLILKANSTSLVEVESGVIHGFVIVIYRAGSRVGNVETIDVDPKFQKCKVGTRLLSAAEADMRQNGIRVAQLETSERNKRALALYSKMGYAFKRKLPGFYRYPHNGTCDAVQLVKAL